MPNTGELGLIRSYNGNPTCLYEFRAKDVNAGCALQRGNWASYNLIFDQTANATQATNLVIGTGEQTVADIFAKMDYKSLKTDLTWVQIMRNGNTFYFDNITKESTRKPPMDFEGKSRQRTVLWHSGVGQYYFALNTHRQWVEISKDKDYFNNASKIHRKAPPPAFASQHELRPCILQEDGRFKIFCMMPDNITLTRTYTKGFKILNADPNWKSCFAKKGGIMCPITANPTSKQQGFGFDPVGPHVVN